MERKPIIGISSSVIVDESGSFAGYKRAYGREIGRASCRERV